MHGLLSKQQTVQNGLLIDQLLERSASLWRRHRMKEFSLGILRTQQPFTEFLHAILLISIEFSTGFSRGYGTKSGDAINSQ